MVERHDVVGPRWAIGPAVIAANLNNANAQTASLRPSACAVPNYAPNLAILTCRTRQQRTTNRAIPLSVSPRAGKGHRMITNSKTAIAFVDGDAFLTMRAKPILPMGSRSI